MQIMNKQLLGQQENDQELFLTEQNRHLQVLRELHNWTKAIELIIYFAALC